MISKRKSRRVAVGGTVFRHKVSATPQSREIYRLNITIQSKDHNASKLVVEGLIQKDLWGRPRADHAEVRYYPLIGRRQVGWFIREAVRNGWNYAANGPNFVLQVTNEIFRPGFWAAERAQSDRSGGLGASSA